MRINKAYHKMFPNNCPVIETTGDGVEVGTCTYYLRDNVCPRHGDITVLLDPDEGREPDDSETDYAYMAIHQIGGGFTE